MGLNIASIVDEFSFLSLSHNANLLNLRVNDWKLQVATFHADFLFVESAWFGYERQWHRKVSEYSLEIDELIAWFKSQNIPTVFWCKEDPIHFDRFLETASHFDFVFTTDIESIPRYRASLGHSRIHLLPFSCQPKFHNPIESFHRKNSAVYAGSFYRRYVERMTDAVMLFELAKQISGLEIFDRYFNSNDVNYSFPEEYQPNIKGYLQVENIDIAYKGYRYGINLNTVKNSRSMFSRRALELLGSGTIVVGNQSNGLDYLFGQITLSSDLESALRERFIQIKNEDLLREKLSLNGVRKVMQEHTCAHRLNTISNIVFSKSQTQSLPSILVLIDVRQAQPSKLKSFILSLSKQSFVGWSAVLLSNSESHPPVEICEDDRFVFASKESDFFKIIEEMSGRFEWVALMNPLDYYGPNYLLDLVLGSRYSSAKAFGKAEFFECIDSQPTLYRNQLSYKAVNSISPRSSIISTDHFLPVLRKHGFNLFDMNEVWFSDAVSLDFFNYCKNAYVNLDGDLKGLQDVVDDYIENSGLSIDDLYAAVGKLETHSKALGSMLLRAAKLASFFGNRFTSAITGVVDKYGWHIISDLLDGDTYDLYSEFSIPIEELGGKSGTPFYLEAGVGLQMQLLVRFELSSGALLDEAIFEINTQNQLSPPDSCTHIRLGYRITSSGSSRITRLVLA